MWKNLRQHILVLHDDLVGEQSVEIHIKLGFRQSLSNFTKNFRKFESFQLKYFGKLKPGIRKDIFF